MILLAENFYGLTTATAPSKFIEFSGTITTAAARFSNSSGLRLGNFNHLIGMYIPDTNPIYTGLAFKASINPTVTNTTTLIGLKYYGGISSNHLSLNLRLSQLYVYNTDNTLLGSYFIPNFLSINWYYLELGAVIHPTSGSFEVRLDGTTVISGSNVKTQGGDNPYCNNIYLFDSFSGNSSVDITDWYACDTTGSNTLTNGFLGDIRIVSLIPSQSGDQVDFKPLSSSLNSALMLDDANLPDGDLTYVSASAIDSMDLYKMTNYTGSVTTVYGVNINTYARKTDTGVRQLSLAVKSGSNISYSPSQSVRYGYGWNSYGFDTNPDTSAAWGSLQDVLNSQVGFKIVR